MLPTGSVRLAAGGRIEDLPGYTDGAWWVQDAAAALPARLIGDVAGKSVVDLCAAPGGKTAQLAAAGAAVTAVDQSGARLKRLAANLERLRPHELAQLNPVDAEKIGVKEGDQIRVTSRRGSIITRVTVTDKVPPGIMFMTFHYWESPVNELTNSAFDPISKTAEYKVSAVRIEKVS